ncbi:hypothetical protein LAZ67_2006153 [Cordylochernes scorpioides]|uniref:Reverse transcriptase domain-containing protein n=1 Tax=Cordylochernes scorpioides TaxID=51811 RepID=A0ABY6K6N8_9ARAC|nr:hypothetical protein LAZ67_2006153 [Cordylochernes scorpioides]
MGLNYNFVNLIKNYYENMTAVVRWNNSYTEFIKIRSGVLQGEPLSLYLFLLFINDLRKIFDDSNFPGIYLPNFGNIHILLYEDDIVLIGGENRQSDFSSSTTRDPEDGAVGEDLVYSSYWREIPRSSVKVDTGCDIGGVIRS